MKSLKVNVKAAQQIKGVHEIDNKENDILFNKNECSKICENIYLSSYRHSIDKSFIKNNSFTHIINCAIASKNYSPIHFDKMEYLNLDLKDDPGFDILYSIFCCIDFIENALKKNGKILMHCYEVSIYFD